MRMLFGEIRPARVLATHAHALALPSMQRARVWSGRGMPQVDRAVEEEPVACEHVEIVVLRVVLAAREVGEEADRVVHEAGVAHVAVEEGTPLSTRMSPDRSKLKRTV